MKPAVVHTAHGRQAAAVLAFMSLVSLPLNARAQTITPRTVPVHMNQQFDFLPSERSGMAGVSIALNDNLLDPFVNPAKATRARMALLSVAPFFHSVSDDHGSGRTLPISGAGSFGSWAGGGFFALQQLDRPRRLWNTPISERTASNQYIMGLLAHDIGTDVAIGGSAYWADLGAEEGVDLLYSGSDRIQQIGSASDIRLGMTKTWNESRQLEFMLVRTKFDMTHDVHYPRQQLFDPRSPTPITIAERSEHNRDLTTTLGAHAAMQQTLGENGWRIGWLATVNRLSHPKIPDYRIGEVFTVPRDPGYTWAYNAGIGFAKKADNSTFGLDVILEPMHSTTWAEAARDTMTTGGSLIPKGAHTVDNRFRFSNAVIRFGFAHDAAGEEAVSTSGFQVGLAVYSIRYRL